MNFLIDTHALIWFIDDDSKLPEKIKDELESKANRCYVSIASIWEMGIKFLLKKLKLKKDLSVIIKIIESTFDILPVTSIQTNDRAFALYKVSLWWDTV